MRETVAALAAEMRGTDVPCELVCIDDHSEAAFAEMNRAAAEAAGRYVVLPQNVGRARVRNLFLQYARHEYLLFLDCDSAVQEGFLQRYAEVLRGEQRKAVVCGGRVYAAESDDREHHLRYVYGVRCESKDAQQRRRHPYRSFMTNNFMVHRDVLERIPFDERISRYGHEDTLFGYRLMQQSVPIVHIDNPVVNGDVERNEVFLEKTEEGVKSLAEIYRWMGEERGFVEQVALLRCYCMLHRLRVEGMVYALFRLTGGWLRKGFVSGRRVNMKLFSFYKLGLLTENLRI
ncbi:MAG: glycosyltransferase family 2 protein [Bacteroidales bacterium]|nr:glycosyltransferase family 2 protein [Bacteroidales bacterium]